MDDGGGTLLAPVVSRVSAGGCSRVSLVCSRVSEVADVPLTVMGVSDPDLVTGVILTGAETLGIAPVSRTRAPWSRDSARGSSRVTDGDEVEVTGADGAVETLVMGPDPRTRVPWSRVISVCGARVSDGPLMGLLVPGPDLVTVDTGGEAETRGKGLVTAWSRETTLGIVGRVGRGRRAEAETVETVATVARLPGEE